MFVLVIRQRWPLSSGRRQEYLDKVSVLVTGGVLVHGVYPKCHGCTAAARFWATVLQCPSG